MHDRLNYEPDTRGKTDAVVFLVSRNIDQFHCSEAHLINQNFIGR